MDIKSAPIIGFYIKSFSGLQKEVWLLSLVMFINRCGLMVIPFLALYLAEDLGWSKSQIGIATSCFGIGALLGAYWGGKMSDKFGAYPVMVFSLFSGGIGFILLSFITDYYLFSFGLFLTSFLADLIRPSIFSAVSTYSAQENVARGISMVRLAFNAGISIGPAVGGFLVASFGYKWLFVANGLTAIVAGILLSFIGYVFIEIRKSQKSNSETASLASDSPYKDRFHLIFLGLNLLILTCFFQILFSVPTYFTEVFSLSKLHIGWFFTVNGLLIFIFEMPIIFGLEKRNLSLGPLVIGAIMMGAAFAANTLVFIPITAIILFSLLIAFGEIINFPFISTISLKRANPESTGQYMGSVTVAFSLAFFLAPLLGLPVIELIGYQIYWLALFIICATSGVLIYLMKDKFISSESYSQN